MTHLQSVGEVAPAVPRPAGQIGQVDRYLLAARLQGYLGRHREAIEVADQGLREHPGNGHLLKLRGEKRLVMRDLSGALSDFEAAVELLANEPDVREFYRPDIEQDAINLILGRVDEVGPQRLAVSASANETGSRCAWGNAQSLAARNLGVARYLSGEFDLAAESFASARQRLSDGHTLATVIDWEYMSLRRAGRDVDAWETLQQTSDVDLTVGVNPAATDTAAALGEAYLLRLQMYRGELGPEDLLRIDSKSPLAIATLGYGVGNWYLYGGYPRAAARSFQRVIELGEWASYGRIAAEIDNERCLDTAVANRFAPMNRRVS